MTHHPITSHTFLLSLLHLLVDGLCACGLMMMSCQITDDIEVYSIIVLYDVLAFGTQPLTGRWVDKNNASPFGLKLAMALLISGAFISFFPLHYIFLSGVTGAILLGIGNSIFHVYGGKYLAVVSHNDIRMMGIFVSTGAIGLAIGLGFSCPILLGFFLLTLLVLSALHLHIAETLKTERPLLINTEEAKQSPALFLSRVPVLYLSCLMLVVSGRSFIGEVLPSLRTSIPSLGVPLTMVAVSIIVMIGKAGGGFLSRKWGVKKVFLVSMLLSATAFLMYPWHNVFVLITLLLINISMPCTLYLATKAVPRREGWSFGLLAMALLPGYLLGHLSKDNTTCQMLLDPLMATILLETLLLLLCIRERRWQVLATSVVLNIITNVPLNAFVLTYRITFPYYLIGLECIIVVVEFFGYWLVLHNHYKAFKYSFLCNSFSALVGCLYQYFIMLLSPVSH